MKAEYKIGDTAHLSVGYITNIKIRLKFNDSVVIAKIFKADERQAGGYLYSTDKGEIPQSKLYSKAQWEKCCYLESKLNPL